MTALWEDQVKRKADQRSILFICHSTGGILLKQALSGKADTSAPSLTSRCIGIAFFAVPHHGSSVLSGPAYARTVRDRMGLKWEMSEKLRENFALRSQDLKNLNYNFAKAVIGIKVFSYVETYETELNVLSNSDGPGESLLPLRLCIVDGRSAVLNSADVPVDEEDIVNLNTTHVGAPQFDGQGAQCTAFVERVASFIHSFNTEERAAYNSLTSSIMNDIHVNVHQFYQIGDNEDESSIKVWSEYPSLQRFFDLGPKECLKERLGQLEEQGKGNTYGNIRPKLEISPASEPAAPTITVTVASSDVAYKPDRRRSSQSIKTLSPELPAFNMAELMNQPLERFHTRRPSLPRDSGAAITGHLVPKKPPPASKASEDFEYSEKVDRLHRAHTYQLPSVTSDRFRWIHVPFTHAGWVPVSS